MTGLEMSSDMIASREAALFHTLDNPDRRHESDGFGVIHQPVNMADSVNISPDVPIVGSPTADLGMPEAQIAPLRLTDEARHDSGSARHEARISVLLEAHNVIHGARSRDYGAALDNHTATADMLSAYLRRKYGIAVSLTAEDVCLFNVLQKVARLANTPDHRDSLVDIAGYAGNVEMVQQERARRG
jgi:hypothetical protein